jgi:iron complex transport system substrate-binding protein
MASAGSIAGFVARALFAAATALATAACGGPTEAKSDRQGAARIASLSPALTATAAELGAGAAIVGRTPWCTAVDASVPVLGSLVDCDLERLVSLRPTLLLVQSRTPSDDLVQVARAHGIDLRCWHLDSVQDVQTMVHELGREVQARGIAGAQAAADAIVSAHLQAVQEPLGERAPTLLLFSTDPPMAFGVGTYPDGLWRGMGGANAIDAPGYPQLGAEDIVRLAPARTVVVGRGAIPDWLHRATRGPVVMLDAPFLLEPGARMLRDGPPALRAAAASDGGPVEVPP